MRIVVTGGGTGGHVYPALEVARLAVSQGHEVEYWGSVRGQEVGACKKHSLRFVGFRSEPVYSAKTPRGWKAIAKLGLATIEAHRRLGRKKPDAILSTGGYSSAPVIRAAILRGIPFVVHEQNAAPGRANLMTAKKATVVATTFHAAGAYFEGCRVVRTGLPLRAELRALARPDRLFDAEPLNILVVGGSQGAAALNEAALAVAARMTRPLKWLHVTGPKHFETVFPTYEKLGLGGTYRMKAFLEGAEMGEAYGEAAVVVGRSGAGTLSELAAFGLPSVLVPYPHAYANHQMLNAKEFEELGGAVCIPQAEMSAARLESALASWVDAQGARESARAALRAWDVPDAATRILELVTEAGTRK